VKKLLLLVCLLTLPTFAAEKPQLWLYFATNLAVDKNIDSIREIWTRAAKAGYTHVLLTDSKLAKLGDLGDNTKHYFANIERVKKIAAELKLELVPAMFDVGYSNSTLWHDPNLAEGLPVKDQPFVVNGGQGRPVNEIHFPAKLGFKDDQVKVDGGIATVENHKSNARFTYQMKLPKYRAYHVTVKIKTENYTGKPEIKAIGGPTNRELQWRNLGVKPTQDWTEHHAVFNTLDNDSVNIYFGVWGDATGTLQWKDWKIQESGLVHVLRRPGTPCTVKDETGRLLTEGTDYERIVDPKLGNSPWPGEFDAWHEPVTIKTKLADGTRLLVSWYHPAVIYDEQVSACINEPKFKQLLADQSKRMKSAWGTSGYMMSHDEFRTLGWDDSCAAMHQTPGQELADNVRYCTALLKGSRVYVWNDMFDPFHNAVPGPYYLVNGPWTASWEGLDKSVVIMNWNFGKRDESLKFFADRGHEQIIAGFYDGPLKDAKAWAESAKKVKGVVGFMYTTWRQDYKSMEAYARICREE
jgi:hypothetical protein